MSIELLSVIASACFWGMGVLPGDWAYARPVAPYAGELLVLRQTRHLPATDAAGVAHLVSDPHNASLVCETGWAVA